jgi:hypothetical protein
MKNIAFVPVQNGQSHCRDTHRLSACQAYPRAIDRAKTATTTRFARNFIMPWKNFR